MAVWRTGGVWIGAAILAAALPARAQLIDRYFPNGVPGYDVNPVVTVLGRSRPDFESPGIRAGAFVIRPAVAESLGYVSNVLGRAGGPGSPVIESSAALRVDTDWSRNALGASVSVDDQRYPDVRQESRTNWQAFLGGRYDIGRDAVGLSYGHIHQNLSPTDIENFGLAAPVPYDVDTVGASYATQFGRLSVSPDLRFSAFRFGSAASPLGVSDERSLDRDVVSGGVALRYEVAADRGLILVLRGAQAHFLNPLGQQDYVDGAILAGIDVATGLVRTRALVGYEQRAFNGTEKAIHAPVAEADVIWTPTRLTTLTGVILRRIEDPTADVVGSITYNEARLTVDHEYLRNVLLAGYVDGQVAQSQQRSQTMYGGGVSVTYLLNRVLGVTVRYDGSRGHAGAPFNSTSHSAILQVRFGL